MMTLRKLIRHFNNRYFWQVRNPLKQIISCIYEYVLSVHDDNNGLLSLLSPLLIFHSYFFIVEDSMYPKYNLERRKKNMEVIEGSSSFLPLKPQNSQVHHLVFQASLDFQWSIKNMNANMVRGICILKLGMIIPRLRWIWAHVHTQYPMHPLHHL